jgi:PhzF family phenazine biosynthesis protein
MPTRPFQQVDVFTATPYQGNPLAVVLDGADLSDAELQRFANWTHLSETTFLLPPTPEGRAAGADYRVRILERTYGQFGAAQATLRDGLVGAARSQ